MLVLGGYGPHFLFCLLFFVAVNICLFVCLFEKNANMTMCALDTRNDSTRDTNAVINVLTFLLPLSYMIISPVFFTLAFATSQISPPKRFF